MVVEMYRTKYRTDIVQTDAMWECYAYGDIVYACLLVAKQPQLVFTTHPTAYLLSNSESRNSSQKVFSQNIICIFIPFLCAHGIVHIVWMTQTSNYSLAFIRLNLYSHFNSLTRSFGVRVRATCTNTTHMAMCILCTHLHISVPRVPQFISIERY